MLLGGSLARCTSSIRARFRGLGGRLHTQADQLRGCLEGLGVLTTAAHEVLVVDNCPTDDRTRQ